MCACAVCACARLQESTKPDIHTSDKLKWLTHKDRFLQMKQVLKLRSSAELLPKQAMPHVPHPTTSASNSVVCGNLDNTARLWVLICLHG